MLLRRRTTFTDHAYERVGQRLIESPDELASILDNDLAVIAGVEPYSNRLSRVFLSLADHEYYVAVQDFSTGSVVTVLPLDYYANLQASVPEKLLHEAAKKRGMEAPVLESLTGTNSVETQHIVSSSVIRITAVNSQNRPPMKNLGSWPLADTPPELENLVANPAFIQEVLHRLAAKGIACTRKLKIRLTLGKSGHTVDIEFGELLNFPHRVLGSHAENADESAPATPSETTT